MIGYRITEAGRSQVRHLVRAHYLRSWPGVVVAIFALLDKWEPIGTAIFALPPRETAIRYNVAHCWELARLFITDTTPKNTETWFMARVIRSVMRSRPEVQLLVSYADPSAGHTGVIYRAGNWIYDGMTDEDRKSPRVDYEYAGVRYSRRSHVPEGVTAARVPRVSKCRFIYWLDGTHETRRQSARAAR